jgi:hypothetical protein
MDRLNAEIRRQRGGADADTCWLGWQQSSIDRLLAAPYHASGEEKERSEETAGSGDLPITGNVCENEVVQLLVSLVAVVVKVDLNLDKVVVNWY